MVDIKLLLHQLRNPYGLDENQLREMRLTAANIIENPYLQRHNNQHLFEKFSQWFEVNKWTEASGFKDPLEFYIHELWKRDPAVMALNARIEELENKMEQIFPTLT